MAIREARAALESEREALQRQIDLIDKALAVLNGQDGGRSVRKRAKASKEGSKKTSRADLTPEQALERYGAEAVTCPQCGKIARAPQGMKAHLRSHST